MLNIPDCDPFHHWFDSTEKADDTFARLIVVLPSSFTGGAAHVSHGGLSRIMDCSSVSLTHTSVLSWNTDATHEITPITSGYRLAISYNLIHSSNAPRPLLPDTHSFVSQLRHVLLSWKQRVQDDDSGPDKIVYLLDHTYSGENLLGTALKGADADKVGVLQQLADDHHFHIGLASVECHQMGCAQNHRELEPGSDYEDNLSDYDDVDADMEEVYKTITTIKDLTDLEGTKIRDTLDFQPNEKVAVLIPPNLREKVKSGQHAKQLYHGSGGAVSLVLFITPTIP